MNKKQLKTFQDETKDMNFNELRAYLGINSPATPVNENAMTPQNHPMFTLTMDFDYADENRSALGNLHQAEAVIKAICVHATPVVQVMPMAQANGLRMSCKHSIPH